MVYIQSYNRLINRLVIPLMDIYIDMIDIIYICVCVIGNIQLDGSDLHVQLEGRVIDLVPCMDGYEAVPIWNCEF